ncbi:hemolysin family protein [Jatrophihabitans cynanchi]|uniref:Hemolysin family protein n=1 Tax=Jatrophihabitans cynanchi TaxID=2944128 RepID=A0ABY7JWP2_9ACTN|nr:hemolysin family protein [Jatrophihabitans sp. SB3-54]WAX56966.1 hemolysin family protein [Jatrophihabitans sp. SB3-54]
MPTPLGWVALVVLIAANALFVAAEFALTSVDRAKLERLADTGDRRAGLVRRLVGELSFQLSAAQLGITVCSLLLGFVAQPVVADALRPAARGIGLPAGAVEPTAVVFALVLATLAQMLFGELVPQNLAISRPLEVGRRVAPFQRAWARTGRPVVAVFDGAANAIVRALGVTPKQELRAARTPAELRSVITSSAEEGTLGVETALLLDRALSFGAKTAADVMTSRVRMVALDSDATAADLLAAARATGRSRFPVLGEDLDDIAGIVHVKLAFAIARERRDQISVRAMMQPPARVPESLDCDAVLRRLSVARMQLAIVVDEYGGTAGLVTVEDLVEELVGQIRDEHDAAEVPEIEPAGEHRWVVSGQLHKDGLAELLGIDPLPGPFDTVAGILMDRLGRIPEARDAMELAGWQLRVVRMDQRRVDRVAVAPAPDRAQP